jgi:hypothetical protein
MDSIEIEGYVDSQHRLSADVPSAIPPGPVTIWIAPAANEDDAGTAWVNGICREWTDDLSDSRQDIYTITDGEPVDPA